MSAGIPEPGKAARAEQSGISTGSVEEIEGRLHREWPIILGRGRGPRPQPASASPPVTRPRRRIIPSIGQLADGIALVGAQDRHRKAGVGAEEPR